MRVLRDPQNCVCAAVQVHSHSHGYPPVAQPSLIVVKELWNEWELHLMILVSFGLQVFLFFAAGLRRYSASGFLSSLLWLAYLLADSVAIFVLGHLAVHASGAHHQLLFFWAPFVLLHLGGQHTITAFSMQDSQLWRRHLLGLVSQVVVAGYVVSRSSWPDNVLQGAMVLMMMVGILKYVERTTCLFSSDPEKLKSFSQEYYYNSTGNVGYIGQSFDQMNTKSLDWMLAPMGDMELPSLRDSFPWETVLSSTPLNSEYTIGRVNALPGLLQQFKFKHKNKKELLPAYNYVGELLCAVYERLYTKAWFMFPYQLFLPVPFFLILAALQLFMAAVRYDHHQLYSIPDIIVSYVLLIGALILEAASLFICLSSYTTLSEGDKYCCLPPLVLRIIRYINSAARPCRKQWSETLGQHSRIKRYTRQEGIIASFLPEWIPKNLYDKTLTHTPLSQDLKILVLEKILDFGGDQQDWNFTSTRGQLALRKRIDLAGSRTPLYKSIHDVDFVTSLLIWHIATDICYYQDDDFPITDHSKKDMSQELSYYIMYLVFSCKVMLTSSAGIKDTKANREMDSIFFEDLKPERDDLGVKEAIEMVYKASSSSPDQGYEGVEEATEIETVLSKDEQDVHQLADKASSSSQPVNHVQRLRNSMKSMKSPILPRAREVAQVLINIDVEADRWELIADVWLEMLFYVAPRCGGEFHFHHLSTGGEFITHVLLLIRKLGPFLPPPGDLAN